VTIMMHWASIEDFAALFCYFWHRDFPITPPKALGARRIDWTIHIGVIVRNIADVMGLYTRFEAGGRKDAIIRNAKYEDLIALEWEWEGVWGNELDKLKKRASKPIGKKPLEYCVFITYTHTANIDKVYAHVLEKWREAQCPLLLLLIDFEDSKKYASRRVFHNINASIFDGKSQRGLRVVQALPWEAEGTRWWLYGKDLLH